MRNKHFLLLAFACLLTLRVSAQQPDSLLTAAAAAYNEGRYAQAAECYEAVADTYGVSGPLYYNIGNAYYKAGDYPSAILNYERGLKLTPRDEDLQVNLEMARAYVVDKTESLGEFLLVRWYKSVRRLFHSDAWAVTSIALFWIFIATLFAFFFSRRRRVRKASFAIGIVSLVLSVVTLVFTRQTYEQTVDARDAIIFTPSVTVKGSPDASGTDLFLLHEGTKVYIKSTLGSWAEIVIEDGNVGWLPADCFEII